MLPILLRVKDAPLRSAFVSFPERARALNLAISAASDATECACTFFTTGTRRPLGESIAMPMLCCALTMTWGFSALAVSRCEFRSGCFSRASETALTMKGSAESFSDFSFEALRVLRRALRLVKSTLSV